MTQLNDEVRESRPDLVGTVPSTLPARRTRAIISTALLIVVALAGVVFLPPMIVGGLLLVLALGYLFRRVLFTWTTLLVLTALVIMFVPIRRYSLPIPLPFALEPYRVMILVGLATVGVALLLSPNFQWRKVSFGWPIGLFLGSQAISIVANGGTLSEKGLAGGAVGNLFQLSFLLAVFYITRQLLTSEKRVMLLVTLLVWAGVIVAFFAVVERFTHTNVFLMLGNFLPLELLRDEGESIRAGGNRAYGSAQHPIALAVMLCMIIPLAVYLAKFAVWPRNEINRKIVYSLGMFVLFAGILCAVSRTGVVVLGVMFLITLIFRPKLAGMLTVVAVPLAFIGAIFVPKVFESTVLSFLDVDTLVQSQYSSPGLKGQGRLADLAPAFAEVARDPFYGSGLGSRIVVGDNANAYILDNQWLGTLMETGVVGTLGLAIFIVAPPIMLLVFALRSGAAARHAMLAFAIAVALSGSAAAMFFYDAFSFMQTFLVACLYLAIGAWLLNEAPRKVTVP